MPVINADGCPINVQVEGPEGAPVLMLSNSLGTTLRMWDPQVAPFTQHFRLVRYDRRGHGEIRRAPRVPIRWSVSAATCSPCSTHSGSRRPTGAAFRWAAWSANGSAPTRPSGSSGSCSPTPRAIFRTRRGGTTASSWCARKALPAFAAPNMERWFTKGFRERSPDRVALAAGDVRRHPARRLPRLRRGGARHGPARPPAEDQGADAGHRRQARSGDPARGERVHQATTSRARNTPRSTPRTFPMSSSPMRMRRPCWDFCGPE